MILGLGNDLLGDDGIGLLAARALNAERWDGVTLAESSLSGLYLLDLVEGFDDLIVMDSVIGDSPGAVVRLSLRDMGPKPVPSAHYAGLAEALEVARRAGVQMPHRVAVIAVQIRNAQTVGADVDPDVRRAIPEVVLTVSELAEEWGYAREVLPCTKPG